MAADLGLPVGEQRPAPARRALGPLLGRLDAIDAEMAKRVARLAPGDEDQRRVEIGDRHRPDDAPGLRPAGVDVVERELALAADRGADRRQMRIALPAEPAGADERRRRGDELGAVGRHHGGELGQRAVGRLGEFGIGALADPQRAERQRLHFLDRQHQRRQSEAGLEHVAEPRLARDVGPLRLQSGDVAIERAQADAELFGERRAGTGLRRRRSASISVSRRLARDIALTAARHGEDGDLRFAIDARVDRLERGRRGDLGLRRLLDDDERAAAEPAAGNERGQRRAGEPFAIGRIEEGEVERPARRRSCRACVASARQMRVTPPSAKASTLARSSARASDPLSTSSAKPAPRDSASIASAPEPAKRSTTRAPSTAPAWRWARMSKIDSRSRSDVGRIARQSGA